MWWWRHKFRQLGLRGKNSYQWSFSPVTSQQFKLPKNKLFNHNMWHSQFNLFSFQMVIHHFTVRQLVFFCKSLRLLATWVLESDFLIVALKAWQAPQQVILNELQEWKHNLYCTVNMTQRRRWQRYQRILAML